MKHLYLTILVSVLFYSKGFSVEGLDKMMLELKKEVSKKEIYLSARYKTIDSLKVCLKSASNTDLNYRFGIYQELYSQYKSFIYDSAFNYALKAQEMAYRINDRPKISLSKLNFGFILISSGMFKEAFDTLKTLHTSEMSTPLLADYYSLMERSYLDLIGYDGSLFYTSKYDILKINYFDSTISLFKEGEKEYFYYTGLKSIDNANFRQAQTSLEKLIHDPSLDLHVYAMTASSLSYVYMNTGETDKAIEMLFEAIKADIRSSTKETMAAFKLAEILYNEGFVKEAYYLIELALDDATFYNSNLRKKQISSILPTIAGKELSTIIKQKRLLFRYSLATTILSLLIVIFLIITVKNLRQLKLAKKDITDINNKLLESNKIKDEYIGYYFYNNSDYIDKIEKFKKAIVRKLMTKRVDDIEMIINTINPQKEREELFAGFDRVFLRLFPHFIEHFNSLLKDEDKMVIKDKNTLNTDLRIFALIRIGIDDHEKISRILGYSVSTIYNYKTKIRKKAICPPDKFEEEVLKIKPI
jgi:hypothetical protein